MPTIVENLTTRRDAIIAELASLEFGSPGGNPNVAMDIGPDHVGAIDHQGYKRGLYDELEKLKKLIHDYSDPWEVRS